MRQSLSLFGLLFAFGTSLPAACQSASTDVLKLELLEFYDGEDGRAHVQIRASGELRPVFGSAADRLLRSEPATWWDCEVRDNDSDLQCEAAHRPGLPPASRIRLIVEPAALQAKGALPVGGLDVQVETSRARLYWHEAGTDARGRPLLRFHSWQPLRPESLRGKVLVRQGDRQWPLDLRPAQADPSNVAFLHNAAQVWSAAWPEQLKLGESIEVFAQPGILMSGGPLPSTATQPLLRWLPPAQLEFGIVCDTRPRWPCYRDSPWQLRANTWPDTATLQALPAALPAGVQFLTATPELIAETIPGAPPQVEQRMVWPLRFAAAAKSYRIKIDSDWRGVDGQAPAERELRWTSADPRPSGSISPATLLLPLGAPAPQQSFRWQNWAALNAEEFAVGEGDAQRQFIPFRESDPVRKRQQDLAASGPEKFRRSGGSQWGRLGAERFVPSALDRSDASWLGAETPIQFARAWADVGLHARLWAGQLQVWATDLYSAGALPNVEVELLEMGTDPAHPPLSVLANSRTDAVGEARLSYPAKPDGELLLRARRGTHVTVMPLRYTGLERQGYVHPAQRELRSAYWVWTDRLRYRPGETVQFRVFQRDRDGVGLRTPAAGTPLDLQIVGYEDPHLTVQLDEFGAASGSWQIPQHYPLGQYQVGDYEDARAFAKLEADPQKAAALSLQLPETSVVGLDPLPVRLLIRADRINAQGSRIHIEGRLRAVSASVFGEAFDFDSDLEGLQNDRGAFDRRFCRAPGPENTADFQMEFPPTADGFSQALLTPPPFDCDTGDLELTPVLTRPGQATMYGEPAGRLFSREPQRLSLKLSNQATTGVELSVQPQAIRMADLQPLPDTPISLVMDVWQDGWQNRHQCVVTGRGECRWTPAQEGRWRITASAPGFQPLTRMLQVRGVRRAIAAPASLVVLDSTDEARVQLKLQQPYPSARILLSVEAETVLQQEWREVNASESTLPLELKPEWPGCVVIAALIVPVTPHGQPLQPSLDTATRHCRPHPAPTLATLELQTGPATDGRLQVQVRSLHSQTLSLSLSVYSDASSATERRHRDPLIGRFLSAAGPTARAGSWSLQSWANPQPATLTEPDPTGGIFLTGGSGSGGESTPQPPANVAALPAVTALWLPAERLEPGQTREFSVELPDRVRRWRVEVLAADAETGFQWLQAEVPVASPDGDRRTVHGLGHKR